MCVGLVVVSCLKAPCVLNSVVVRFPNKESIFVVDKRARINFCGTQTCRNMMTQLLKLSASCCLYNVIFA